MFLHNPLSKALSEGVGIITDGMDRAIDPCRLAFPIRQQARHKGVEHSTHICQLDWIRIVTEGGAIQRAI
jgi:hypothetical protein